MYSYVCAGLSALIRIRRITVKQGANILLALMQLNIGGAETHVVELAKELKRRGFNVIVTSNGGVYVKELEEAGIKHYSVPLQNKNPFNMIRASKRLASIIKKERIDIVHSHARIPSFILGKLHKKMKFPFVTTAHWVFTTKYGLKYITDWGEKTVAVSEDIKKYLMDNYKIPEGDICVTINGIDTERFSPYTDVSDVKAELDIKPDEYVIVYVSRLDESRSLVAKQYINIMPEIAEHVKNPRLIVVGGGDDFENVRHAAARVNGALGREAVTLTGPRTDINKLAALAKLFVGVSRAALEAMAAEKPVIIAGNEGYIGLFDESKLKTGIDTNFCCRGCAGSTGDLLLNDTLKFLSMTEEQQAELGRYGRELIKKKYSVARMTDDSIKVYDWALSKQDEILISGYYGFKNSGDDALLKAITDNLKKHIESPNIVVLSASPKETARAYRVKSINRLSPFAVYRHMKKAGMLISGGGTLIQDRTSTKSLWYYLAVIKAAKRMGLRVMLYSNGIGPLKREQNIRITKKILDEVDLITLRDKESLETLKRIGVSKPKMLLTADPALTLTVPDKAAGRRILFEAKVPDRRLLGISVRRWNTLGSDFESIMARVCDRAASEYGLYPVFLPMQASKDMGISKSIAGKMKEKSTVIENHQSVNDMLALVGSMDFCIGMRLHMLMYAAINSVPLIGIAYDPKINSFMKNMGQAACINADELTEERLFTMLEETIRDCVTIKDGLKRSYTLLEEKARRNGALAAELYKKGSVDI